MFSRCSPFNQYPQTKYSHYADREILYLFDSRKDDPEYVIELKHRLERLMNL